jgi:hypothetical protein
MTTLTREQLETRLKDAREALFLIQLASLASLLDTEQVSKQGLVIQLEKIAKWSTETLLKEYRQLPDEVEANNS